jgi:hypothetical protein
MIDAEKTERELSIVRTELVVAQAKLKGAIEREQELADKRLPLLREAKLHDDGAAQKQLDRLTQEKNITAQEIADLRYAIQSIENDIARLEEQSESHHREGKLTIVRKRMADRNKVAEKIQKQVEDLAKSISEYIRIADDTVSLANELELPNTTTRAIVGVPLLKDFFLYRFKFLFPAELGNYTEQSQRIALTIAEENAREALEFSIKAAQRKAA